MFITTSKIAYASSFGHNGVQYPDMNVTIVVPEGTFLNKLSWVCGSEFEAWTWASSDSATVVWIKK